MWSHRPDGRHDIYKRHERSPAHSPNIDRQASPTEMEGTTLEFAIEHLADDRDAVRLIKSDGSQIEDGRNGDVGPQADQIDKDASDGEEPNCVDGGVCLFVNLIPDSRQG